MKDNKRIILIGGAPTAGKSTMAKLLSKHFDIPWISTDQIREIMRGTVSEEKYPALFGERNYTAEQFYGKFIPEEITAKEMNQSEETWIGIRTFIKKDFTWPSGFIIEGVNLLPHLIARDFQSDRIKSIFLVDEDAGRIRDVVFTRGLWGNAKDYSDDVKEKEIEWVQSFNKIIKTEAEKYNFPCIEVAKHENDLPLVLKVLGFN